MMGKLMTKQQLCDAVYQAVLSAKKPLTRMQICTAIGRKKSPHIIDMIERLYNMRYFERSYVLDDFGRGCFVYSPGTAIDAAACQD